MNTKDRFDIKTFYKMKPKYIIKSILLLSFVLLLVACGGGNDGNDDKIENAETSQPALENIRLENAAVNLKPDTDDTVDITLIFEYTDETTDEKSLTISWNNQDKSFELADTQASEFAVQYTETTKKLNITEKESQKQVTVDIAFEELLDLIANISLTTPKQTLTVGESVQLASETAFTISQNIESLPEGAYCKLQSGADVLTVTPECEVTAKIPGTASVTLEVPLDLLDTSAEIPIVDFTVEAPPVTVTGVSLNINELTVSKAESSIFNLTLTRHFNDESIGSHDFQIQWNAETKTFATSASFALSYENNVLTINDSESGFSATISVTESAELLPQITEIRLIIPSTSAYVGDSVSVSVVADYDNGDTNVDVTSLVNCYESGSALASFSACQFTAQAAGTMTISASLLNNQTNAPNVQTVDVSIAAVEVNAIVLDKTSVDVESGKDSQHNLKLTRQFNNGNTEARTALLLWNASESKFTLNGYMANYDSQLGVLQLTDSISGISVNLNINLTQTPVQVTTLKLAATGTTVYVGDTVSISVLADYDNGDLDKSVSSLVDCSVASGDVTAISFQGCNATAEKAGNVTITASLKQAQSQMPAVQMLSIEILALQVTGANLDIDSITVETGVDSVQSATLNRTYNNTTSDTVDVSIGWNGTTESFSAEGFTAEYNVTGATLVLTETASGKSVSLAVNVLASGPLIEKLYFENPSMTINSGTTSPIIVKARYADGSVVDFNSEVTCQSDTFDLIEISPGCTQIEALYPGQFIITPKLKNQTLAAQNIEIEPLNVEVKPVYLDSLTNASSYILNRTIDTPVVTFRVDGAVIDQAYKFQLSTSLTMPLIALHVLRAPEWGQGCYNDVVQGQTKLACGVKAVGDSLYFVIENLELEPLGLLNYTLNVTEDDNILRVDGNYFLGEYVELTVGEPFLSGHVMANAYGINNISVYRTRYQAASNDGSGNVTPLNMDPDAGDYEVEVKFTSADYQSDTVNVKFNSSSSSQLLFTAACINTAATSTLKCTVPNGAKPTEIVVEIHGNGAQYIPSQNSLTATEGEVEYDIFITQLP